MSEDCGIKRSSSPTVDLLKATSKGKIFRVIQAIDDGAELAVNKHGHSALHIACHKGFLDIVKILVSAGCEVDLQDDNGDTALHRACIAGNDLIARRLIEEGCSVDRQNVLGDSALHEAASRGYSRCVRVLIHGQANIGLKNKNSDTAIHLASANSHSGSLRLLLFSYPNSSQKNAQGDTPLHIAVRFGHVTCSRVLISSKCDINLQNKMGNTPLHIATVARHQKLVRILLDAGGCPKSIRNNENKSAIDLAKDNDHGDIAIMLMSGPYQKHATRSRARHKKLYGTLARRSKSETRIHESRQSNCAVGVCTPVQCDLKAERPKSGIMPRKKYPMPKTLKRTEQYNSVIQPEGGDILQNQQRSLTVNPFVVPQLYSLYRDCHGNVQQQPVVDRLPNPTVEVVSTLVNAVADTKGELLQEMKKTNCMLERRLGELKHNTDFKVAKLDQVTKERIHAERTRCLHRIDRRAMMERAVFSCQNEHRLSHDQSVLDRRDVKVHASDSFSKKSAETAVTVGMCSAVTTSEDFDNLQPYQTVRIPRKGNDVSQLSSSANRNCKMVTDTTSDSAYSSLCPKSLAPDTSALNSKAMQIPSHHDQLDNSQVHCSHPPEKVKEKFPKFCNGDCEATSLVTQQLFENVTHAMEEWYEHRLREITEKQQMDMNKKVRELENKVKLLELNQRHEKI